MQFFLIPNPLFTFFSKLPYLLTIMTSHFVFVRGFASYLWYPYVRASLESSPTSTVRFEPRIPKIVMPREFFSTIRSPEIRRVIIGFSIMPASMGSDVRFVWASILYGLKRGLQQIHFGNQFTHII